MLKRILILFLLQFAFISCQCERAVEAIDLNHDTCDHCKMTISDQRFGGAALMNKGKTMKFDSFECLKAFYAENKSEVKQTYLVDFNNGKLLNASSALTYRINDLRSPMGEGFVAVATSEDLEKLKVSNPGIAINFTDFLKE